VNYSQLADDRGIFTPDATFPNLDANTHDYIALAAQAYLELPAGIYRFGVRSDDGFKVTAGVDFNDRNLVLGVFEGGRSSATTEFNFVVPVAGVYAFRLLYYEGGGDADVEWYSVDRATGTATLINDPNTPGSIKAFIERVGTPLPPQAPKLLNPAASAGNFGFSFASEVGRAYTVEFKNSLKDAAWQTLRTLNGDGTALPVTDPVAGARFYRVTAR